MRLAVTLATPMNHFIGWCTHHLNSLLKFPAIFYVCMYLRVMFSYVHVLSFTSPLSLTSSASFACSSISTIKFQAPHFKAQSSQVPFQRRLPPANSAPTLSDASCSTNWRLSLYAHSPAPLLSTGATRGATRASQPAGLNGPSWQTPATASCTIPLWP